MLNDLKQPTQQWLADLLENFSKALKAGDDPCMVLSMHNETVVIQMRLIKAPGLERHEVCVDGH